MIRKSRRRVLHPCRFPIPVTALAVLLSCSTAVALHASEGDLDPTFGVGGLVTTDIAGASDSGNAVAIQADVAGNTFSGRELGQWNFVIVRYEGTP